MGRSIFTIVRSTKGFSLLELLIAVLITAVIAAAAFQFYITMNQNVITQQDISDMQQLSRSTLQEISKSLRMAGYMLDIVSPGHPPYEIYGDSLAIYVGSTADPTDPVDTTIYFLEEFTTTEYAEVVGRPAGMQIYKMMRLEDGAAAAEIYSDCIKSVAYTPIGTSEVAITLEVQTDRFDEKWDQNDGFHVFSNTERVSMRNVAL